jgi:hypothetical protein
MKLQNNVITMLLAIALSGTSSASTQGDSLGLPGDNFDLYGALHLFKQYDSPEAFEKAINDKGSEINNLDLNNDGKVDYITVVDQSDCDAHAFILQDAVDENKIQNDAVIEIEKEGVDNAHLQIVGDEDFYGKNYIVEPGDENQKTDAAPSPEVKTHTTVMVNVWGWPSVRYIYGPHYRRWVSPWRYSYYPAWFSPWPPVFWAVHHHRVFRYHHPYYHRVYVCHVPKAHKLYYAHHTSPSGGHKQANVANGPHRNEVSSGHREGDKNNSGAVGKRGNKHSGAKHNKRTK